MGTTLRIWSTLMVRDIRTRRGQSRYGFILNLIEPMGQLALVYVVFAALGRRADFGPNLFIFLISGLIPYFTFVHCSGRIMAAARIAIPLRPLRVVNPIDVVIATLLLETLAITIAAALLFMGAWWLGVRDAVPRDPVALIFAMLSSSAIALGTGLINASLVYFFAAYRVVWMLLARSLIFFSSVFFLLELAPSNLQRILVWNPLLHCVLWFRAGVYGSVYPTRQLSIGYLAAYAVGSLVIGLALERLVRRRA